MYNVPNSSVANKMVSKQIFFIISDFNEYEVFPLTFNAMEFNLIIGSSIYAMDSI